MPSTRDLEVPAADVTDKLALKDPTLLCQNGFVGGRWVAADADEVIKVVNPATGRVIATVPKMGAAETRRAIEAANAAFGPWRSRPAKERANLLRRWYDLMMANQDDLALILTSEQGKPLAEAKGEIAYGA